MLRLSQDTENLTSKSKSEKSEASENGGTDADSTGDRYPEPGDGSIGEIMGDFPLDKTGLRGGLGSGTRVSQCGEE